MEKSGPALLQALGNATIRCREAAAGPELDAAREELRTAIREMAPGIEADQDYRARGTIHGLADRWLSGVEVARLLAWDAEPTD